MKEGKPLKLAVVDDHVMIRIGLERFVNDWPHGEVVLTATDGVDYEEQCRTVGHIHIALVDLCMPRRDGYDTIRWIKRNQPRTLPLAMSFQLDPFTVQRAVRAGAHGVLCKTDDAAAHRLALDHLRTTGFHYNTWFSKALRRTWEDDEQADRTRSPWQRLSEREREVLRLYAEGHYTIEAIALRLGLSPNTVETHRRNAFRKLGIHQKAELVRMVLLNGWT